MKMAQPVRQRGDGGPRDIADVGGLQRDRRRAARFRGDPQHGADCQWNGADRADDVAQLATGHTATLGGGAVKRVVKLGLLTKRQAFSNKITTPQRET